MARRLTADELAPSRQHLGRADEITLYASVAGPADAVSSAIRRSLELPVSARIWHRVYPVLPKETRPGGALVLWHPDEHGWERALEWVHARRMPPWVQRGAYVQMPGAGSALPRDFREFDETDLADWSMAVPDARFIALCARQRGGRMRLSELVARWAMEVGPAAAGLVLSQRDLQATATLRAH